MRTQHAAAALAIASSAIIPALAADVPRPRGVGPEFAKYFKSPDTFTCINNPQITIPLSRVNDDVCDCPDGSDEPGTSACSYVSPLSPPSASNQIPGQENASVALPGYYCKNKGHRPSYVPFAYVNDGICDYEVCCDGSDEWAGVGGVKCENKCNEIGKEWREQDETRQRTLNAATKKRQELVADAARLKQECQDRIYTLNTQIEGNELKLQSLRKQLEETERQERYKVVKAPKEGGKMGVLIGQAQQRTAELRSHLQKAVEDRDKHQMNLVRLEGIMKTFKEEYNPNFNDEGVKRAVRAWEDYVAAGLPLEEQPMPDETYNDVWSILKTDEENGLDWNEFAGEETSDTDVLYQFENYLPIPVRSWVNQKLRVLRQTLIENGILAANSHSSSDAPESKAVQDARFAVTSAENELASVRTELTTHQEDLDKDYGADDIFRALKGRCVSKDSGEYTYELCWLDKTVQKPKKGGSDTTMGYFTGFSTIDVDEEVPADGRGVGSGQRMVMEFKNGQHCWNGPARSTQVIMVCAENDEIWKISESEKCTYRMEVGTPAACEGAVKPAHAAGGQRDEL